MSKENTGNAAAAKAAAEKKAAEKAAAEKAAKQGKAVMVPALSVVSARAGFRRAGRAWGKEASVVKLSDLTNEQIKQIKGESLLTVTEVEIEEQAAE